MDPDELLLIDLQQVTTAANIHHVANLRQTYLGHIEMYNKEYLRLGKEIPVRRDGITAAERMIERYIHECRRERR